MSAASSVVLPDTRTNTCNTVCMLSFHVWPHCPEQSEPSLGDNEDPRVQQVFDSLEAFSVAVFTLDFGARLFTAPVNGTYASAFKYLTSFFGVVDVVSVLPWYLEVLETIIYVHFRV